MGEFEAGSHGLGAVSPLALTPRLIKGLSGGAIAKTSGATAWRPSAQGVLPSVLVVPPLATAEEKKKIFLPPFCFSEVFDSR